MLSPHHELTCVGRLMRMSTSAIAAKRCRAERRCKDRRFPGPTPSTAALQGRSAGFLIDVQLETTALCSAQQMVRQLLVLHIPQALQNAPNI